MELACTRVTWLTLDEVIEKCLKEALMKLKENGRFMQEAEDILDMVFESTIHKEAELVRCFKTEKQIHVYLLLVGLSTSETEHLLELINKKMAKFEPKTSGK